MFNKNDIIFYIIAGNVIALIAGLTGANLAVILFSSLLIPPIILIIIRIIRWDTKDIFHKIVNCWITIAYLGVNTLSHGIVAHEDTIKEEPDLLEWFIRAMQKSLAYSLDHFDESIDIYMKYPSRDDRDLWNTGNKQVFILLTDMKKPKNTRRYFTYKMGNKPLTGKHGERKDTLLN